MSKEYQYSSAELLWIEKQQRANIEIWNSLNKNGFDKSRTVDLDFVCVGRWKELTVALARMLIDDFGYEISMNTTDYANGEEVVSIYQIQGQRKSVQVSPESIDDWCDFMIRICHEFDCNFDGWGVFYKEKS